MNWLKGFPFRRKLIHKEEPLSFIPSLPLKLIGGDFTFMGEDGITPIKIDSQLINDHLYLRLPVDKPIYVYYKKNELPWEV